MVPMDRLCRLLWKNIIGRIRAYSDDIKAKTGEAAYEHLIYRIKSEGSMREKCDRKGLPQTAYSALHDIRDAIGIRIVCCFLDDIYRAIDFLKSLDGVRVVEEKDYIRHVKPNGYRSYHVILELEEPYEDVTGANPGHFYAEVQLRTIAMDSWASLEHQMKYKHDIRTRNSSSGNSSAVPMNWLRATCPCRLSAI